jgi:hypothetical protein
LINNDYDFKVFELESAPKDTNILITPFITTKWFNMVKNESKEESANLAGTTSPTTNAAQNVLETIRDNIMSMANKIAILQPQYVQSISNLQIEYLKTTRTVFMNMISLQNNIVKSNGSNRFLIVAPQYLEQIRNQSNEAINYFNKSCEIGNEVAVKSIDLARENISNYKQSFTSADEFNRNLWNSSSYLSTQQQTLNH